MINRRTIVRPANRSQAHPKIVKPIEEVKGEAYEELKQRHDALKTRDSRGKREITELRGRKSENELKLRKLREKHQRLQRDLIRAQEMVGLNSYGGSRHQIPQELFALLSGQFGSSRNFQAADLGIFIEMLRTDTSYDGLLALQERIGFVSTGLTDEEIAGIPLIALTNTEDNCAVCQEELGSEGKKLPTCDHYYHGDCIDQWLKRKRTCPVCVAEVPRSS
jgi:hypothetical protein